MHGDLARSDAEDHGLAGLIDGLLLTTEEASTGESQLRCQDQGGGNKRDDPCNHVLAWGAIAADSGTYAGGDFCSMWMGL